MPELLTTFVGGSSARRSAREQILVFQDEDTTSEADADRTFRHTYPYSPTSTPQRDRLIRLVLLSLALRACKASNLE